MIQEGARTRAKATVELIAAGWKSRAIIQSANMVRYEYQFRSSRFADSLITGVFAGLSLYWYIRPALKSKPPTVTRIKSRSTPRRLASAQLPYPEDAFPGGRDVDTAYGTIKVFEWGPEDGEKVLLLHGVGTPCIALGDMAHELVQRGYRVMLFGELSVTALWQVCLLVDLP